MRTDYANLFAELFCRNLAILHTESFLAISRTSSRRKSNCDFGEEHLQNLIADKERRELPDGCPKLYVDKEHQGRIDYKLYRTPGQILASCQLKGPLRSCAEHKLDNHFGPILEDVAKQRRQLERLAIGEHYIGILFCLEKSRAEFCVANVWLPALQAETASVLTEAATEDARLLNGHTATACILRVELRTLYPCGCVVPQQRTSTRN